MGKIYKNGILFAGSTENAKSIAFQNTDTGLEADNVQEAIEEVKSGIDLDIENINSNLLKIKAKIYNFQTGTVTNAVSGLYYGETNIKSDFPTGKILAVIPIACGYGGWETGAGITTSYDNYILQYGCHYPNAQIILKVYWFYM